MTTRAVGRGPVRDAVSAGGVVYRLEGDRVEIVLVARPAQQLWALPKGTPEPDETIEETAIREVSEETGLRIRIERPIGSISYWYAIAEERVRVHKVVHHFLMTPTGGDLGLHDAEYDVAVWCDIHEALSRLSYQNECAIVEQAGALIRDQRV